MLIAIAGGSGSGKSHLSHQIADYLSDRCKLTVQPISMDNYYRNIHQEPFENYDHPDAFNIDQLCHDLDMVEQARRLPLREYSYVSKETDIIGMAENIDVVLLEGLYTFYFDPVRERSQMNLYIDTDETTRIERRLRRDREERSISEEENQAMLKDFVLDMHDRHVSRQKALADVVLTDSHLDHLLPSLKDRLSHLKARC